MKMASSPSESVKSPGAIKSAVERSSGPRYGRPSDRFGPPTALFSPPLARLRHRIEHSDAIPDRAVALATFSLIELSAGFYEDEIQREADLRILLKSLISGTSKWQTKIEDGSARPDGVWLLEGLAYLIVEIKNESGLGGDPFLQGLITYSKILAQEKYSVFIGQSNLPVVLLAIAGNRLTVSTAIFTDSIYADELLSIKLYFGTHASENVLHVARIFMAIDDCARELRDLYGGLINSNGPVPPAKFLWPEPTVVTSYPAEGIPKLEFISKVHRSQGTPINGPTMEEEDKRHAIYLAMIKPDDSKGSDMQVLVKFATRYHENAHRLLADHEPPLAPKLYSCTPVVGGMLMVVMEYIPQSEGASLHNHRPQESALQVIHQNISKALELLHGLDLVFGDLREQNVLYLPSKNHVLLVDFDGVGKHGEDRYSACLNETTSLGVRRLQIMEKLHDKENLERLVARLKR
ncbi:uncharacterized protein EI90DRAFT_3084491 [Cantharellus anzutake]|uniref:uncharacterized protein n=1 Tax=Cantharellus anzutake TaxID=1750568 RepID=UPI001905A66F|nr:uncharacterized protein EI90DRAFT_3084491 [Cantharellus anzutake]KAF8318035.1 hypothetical protein EI90DRAFT_3084491 [Cantharellus anzutake]